ncbi:hypothetical protein [Thiothrix nivea]|uniref:Uncharacterized protein n=1 Tax=Thiothrix nivea (strain ATCC 35100 / DSM 5205 / JP2) TaxID=870187 RepID=A0A656HLR3_THINJ|nr:hypothetical protein [Thiothrix nivea]EIJ37064.1 hypothetical protein Thini_0055 [Thiothrix nivea DSM 5205]
MAGQPTQQDLEDALTLLHEAHQRLLDSHNYLADALIYRAILRLSGGVPVTREATGGGQPLSAPGGPAHA